MQVKFDVKSCKINFNDDNFFLISKISEEKYIKLSKLQQKLMTFRNKVKIKNWMINI